MYLTPIYIAGIVAGHLIRPGPVWGLAPGVACLVMGLAWLRPGRGPGGGIGAAGASAALLAAAAFFAGLFLASAAWLRVAPDPAVCASPRWANLSGRVVSEPRATETGYRFTVRTATAGPFWREGETLYVTVVASPVQTDGAATAAAPVPVPVEVGCDIRVAGLLAAPRPPSNPGEFDFPLYLAAAGIRHTLRAFAPPVVVSDPGSAGFGRLCRLARDGLMSAIDESLPPDQASLLDGLLFGDTSRLPPDVARDFRRAGVYHILAVSGSNVAFVAGGFLLVIRPFLRLVGFRGQRAERLAWPATAVVVAAYAVMSGFGPSVTRATLMTEAGLVYLASGRTRNPWGPVCLAAAVMLARQPLLIVDVGFQLSFAATAGIIGLCPPLLRWAEGTWLPAAAEGVPPFVGRTLRTLVAAGAVSLAAQAAVAPLLAAHFGEISVIGLVANLVVVPLSGLDVTAGLAAAVAHLCGPPGRVVAAGLFAVTSLLLQLTTASAHLAAQAPFASVIVGRPALAVSAGYYATLAWVRRGAAEAKALRRMAAALVVALGLAAGHLGAGLAAGAVGARPAEAVFLDVGQGDALFARLADGRTILVDGGPPGAGERVICPFLRCRGSGRLDTVIVTHGHDDHAGGLAEVIADPGLSIGEILLAPGLVGSLTAYLPDGTAGTPTPLQALLSAAEARGIPVRPIAADAGAAAGLDPEAAGLRLEGADPALDVLWPPASGSGEAAAVPTSEQSQENDRSLVLRLRLGFVTLLLPGDLEATGEARLLETLGRAAPATLGSLGLKVGHHGSPAATTLDFLGAVSPRFAVISVGTNSFGHPSPETEGRILKAGVVLFETKADGAIDLDVRGRKATVTTFLSGRGLRLGFKGP